MKKKKKATKSNYKPSHMSDVELEYHYAVTKKSAHVHRDRSKFNKTSSRRNNKVRDH